MVSGKGHRIKHLKKNPRQCGAYKSLNKQSWKLHSVTSWFSGVSLQVFEILKIVFSVSFILCVTMFVLHAKEKHRLRMFKNRELRGILNL